MSGLRRLSHCWADHAGDTVKTAILGAAAILAALPASAVPQPQLSPIDRNFTPFASYRSMQAYHVAVRDALLRTASHHSCEAMVLPSFQREWAVYIQRRGNVHEVVYAVMREQLWGRMQEAAERPDGSIEPGDEVPALEKLSRETRTSSAPLSQATAEVLAHLCATMLARAQQPPEPPRCIDGTSYYVFQRDSLGVARGGSGSCPQPGTPTASLLAILEDLREAAESSGSSLARSDVSLARKATQLLQKLPLQ